MPRLYVSKRQSRPQPLTGSRASRPKTRKDDSYQEKPNKKKKGGAKYSATTPTNTRRKQITVRNTTDDESTTSGIESAEEGGAEIDEADKPEKSAPFRALTSHEAGRYQYDRSDDNLSEAGETDSMFGGSYNPEQEEELQTRLLDDNDEAYQAVDDISDSDLDEDRIMDEQAKLLLADVTSDGLRDDSEDPSFYLNQIEGMSAYGFGDDSEGSVQFYVSSQSSDSSNETLTRHVRFEETFPEEHAFRGLSESPTMTRALLPSAMPATLMHSLTGDTGDAETSDSNEMTDSDLTDDDLPEAAQSASAYEDMHEDEVPVPSSVSKRLRPPPVGTFIDDGVQSAGTLDSTGTMLLITNPQTLGEEFARRYGASAPPSPGLGFAQAVLGGTACNSPETANVPVPDPMFSGLNSRANATPSGQTISIPEAFFAPDMLGTDDFGVFEGFGDDGSVYSDMDEGERMMKIEDIVAFDTESDDNSPTSPVVGYEAFSSPGLSHLTNDNVMAFRRNADPAFRAMHSSPIAGHAAARAAKLSSSHARKRSKKRKSGIDSPYSDAYYKGVTPVQRVSHPGNELSTPGSSPTKRRRMI